MLKEERHRRILDLLAAEGRVVATDLQRVLGVSGYTVRRDLDELADARRLQRVHGGALARSPVAPTYEARGAQALPGKLATARAAATLLRPGDVAIVDGGSTALALAEAVPPGGTFITHSPPVATALARRGAEVVLVGGTLDARAMVATGAKTIDAYAKVAADVLFLGVWALHPEHGISGGYFEESEVRHALLPRADRVVGLASREKLHTVAPFHVGPATALTHLATDAPADATAPFAELGLTVVRDGGPAAP
jgi:DeoR/GlpR family transcriptional regulator of sugar metabolism